MREDLCELGPSLGRFAGVLLPVLGDKASDSITIGAPHSVPRFKNAANFESNFDVFLWKKLYEVTNKGLFKTPTYPEMSEIAISR